MLFSIVLNLEIHDHFKFDFQKMDQHTGGQVINPWHQTPHGLSVAKPGTHM